MCKEVAKLTKTPLLSLNLGKHQHCASTAPALEYTTLLFLNNLSWTEKQQTNNQKKATRQQASKRQTHISNYILNTDNILWERGESQLGPTLHTTRYRVATFLPSWLPAPICHLDLCSVLLFPIPFPTTYWLSFYNCCLLPVICSIYLF